MRRDHARLGGADLITRASRPCLLDCFVETAHANVASTWVTKSRSLYKSSEEFGRTDWDKLPPIASLAFP
jgi:hypothetical protein